TAGVRPDHVDCAGESLGWPLCVREYAALGIPEEVCDRNSPDHRFGRRAIASFSGVVEAFAARRGLRLRGVVHATDRLGQFAGTLILLLQNVCRSIPAIQPGDDLLLLRWD